MDPSLSPPVDTTPAELPAASPYAPAASYLHTALLVVVLLAIGLFGAWATKYMPQVKQGSPLPQYIQTILMQWILFGLVVWGLRRRGTSLREILGKPWQSFDDFLLDCAIAAGVFIAAIAIRVAVVAVAFRGLQLGTMPNAKDAMEGVKHLIPHTPVEITFAMLLALTAGIVEEFIFRGYLQRQFTALTRNAAGGIFLSGVVFTIGHLYQGAWLQITFVAILGFMLGVLAHFRRNLRPGIILHVGQDAISLLLMSFLYDTLVK